jgi:hypothetical protein
MRVNHCNMQHATCKEGNWETRSMLLNEFGMREIPNKTKERKDKKKGLSALVSLTELTFLACAVDKVGGNAGESLQHATCNVQRGESE